MPGLTEPPDDYDPDIDYGSGPACPHCGEEMGWSDCWNCGGEGAWDGYEEDPLWYDPGEEVTCSQCHGKGGFYICTNKACKGDKP